MIEKDLLRFEGISIFEKPLPWSKYVNAYDLEHAGLFHQNSEGLLKFYDTLVVEKGYEINGRIFLPANSEKGTVRRFIRTPRSSILSKSSVRARSLQTAFEKASVFNVIIIHL